MEVFNYGKVLIPIKEQLLYKLIMDVKNLITDGFNSYKGTIVIFQLKIMDDFLRCFNSYKGTIVISINYGSSFENLLF